MQLCSERGFFNVYIESDSKFLVDCVHGVSQLPWRYYEDLRSIIQLFLDLDCVLCHIFRESNVIVDALARLVRSQGVSTSFTSGTLPIKIRGLVNLDRI